MKPSAKFFVLLCVMACLTPAHAHSPKHRTSGHTRSYRASRRSSASRPYYGGGKHGASHGGQYLGSTNSHHRDGHYRNWRSGNRYGVHE